MRPIVVEAITKEEEVVAHLASTLEKVVEWVKKHGDGWYEEDYCFLVYTLGLDSDESCEGIEDVFYISLDGQVSEDNPLYK